MVATLKDNFSREIDYMRISITDRCNLRCTYCMPADTKSVSHADVLRYEEIMRIVRLALRLGITRFKITGGDPFARLGAVDFITALKQEPGVQCVTITTNGICLTEVLPQLKQAGIDGINISLNAVDPVQYTSISRSDCVEKVLYAISQCAASGIHTKINCVLLDENKNQLAPLAQIAQALPVDVRFIELMPIGYGRGRNGPDRDTALAQLRAIYPDLHHAQEKRGNGPAVYYASDRLKGRIGFIAANSHQFCAECNRIRLTSTGLLKPCLCYDCSVDLRALLRGGASETEISDAMVKAIRNKPAAHCFSLVNEVTERRSMNEIGG